MRIMLSGSPAPELSPVLELSPARVGGLPFEILPAHISDITVDLDIRPGDFVEVVDQDTGELHYGRILYAFSNHFVIMTINGFRYCCATLRVSVRVQLEGTRVPSQSGSK